MLLARHLEARGVPNLVVPSACAFVPLIRPAGQPAVFARLLMPRYDTSLHTYLARHAQAGSRVPRASAALVVGALLGALASMQRCRVLHK